MISPYFRFHRYQYQITEEFIDVREGYIFVERQLVPLERLHKMQTNRGPIDRMFRVAKVTVTTAGGDVTLRFLDEEKADYIAESLSKRINQIVVEQRDEDGREVTHIHFYDLIYSIMKISILANTTLSVLEEMQINTNPAIPIIISKKMNFVNANS